MSFDLLKTKVVLCIFLSLETLALRQKSKLSIKKSGNFKEKSYNIFDHTSHKETKYEEPYFLKVLEI